MTAPEHRHLFVHLQKTAGTTLRQRVSHLLGEAAIYPSDLDGDMVTDNLTFSVPELLRRLPRRLGQVEVVFGHFPLCTAALLPGRYRTATMLRDPLERTLSYLRHHREWTPEDRGRPLEEIYDDPVRHRLAADHMTKMLGMTAEEMTDGMLSDVTVTGEHLARAKAALGTIDVIGVQERFADFVADLERCFGWRLGDRPRFANRSTPVDVDEDFVRRIDDDNAADRELYDHARHLLAERRTELTCRT